MIFFSQKLRIRGVLFCFIGLLFVGCAPASFTPKTATEQAEWAAIYLRDRHPENIRQALRLNQLSAEQNNPHGQRGLGFMYEFGLGLERNIDEASRLYNAAATQGVESSYVDSIRTATISSPVNTARPQPSQRITSPVDELNELASSDCRTRGLSRGSARWSRCEQEARTLYAASGNLHDSAATRRILSDHAVADSRCFSAGLRRGTTEFETCTIQARINLRSEAYASDQAAMRTRLETDRQQAIEMARLEAEKARREERNFRMMQLGLGMAAGAYSAPPPPQTRTYIINGRPFHCSTTGGITNCF